MNVIEVENLSKVFKTKNEEKIAVDNINLKVEKGEKVAFIGPNGAGKSTTIKMLTGILSPTKGRIVVLGYTPLKERKKLSYKLGTVFGQKTQLWFHLPVEDTFKLMGEIYDVEKNILEKRIKSFSEKFEIQDLMNKKVKTLSLGQRIRCEIVASLLHKPEIIFLDEPTIGLDVVIKKKIRNLINEMNKEEGVTIFLTSHDTDDIEHVCDRVIIINDGKIIRDLKTKELKNEISKKIVEIKFNKKIDFEIKNVKIIEKSEYDLKIEIDTKKKSIHEFIGEISKNEGIVDITITDPPLEEIITDIFKGVVVE